MNFTSYYISPFSIDNGVVIKWKESIPALVHYDIKTSWR